MSSLARNGSVLVAEIKAVHPPKEASNGNGNGAVPYYNGDAPNSEGAVYHSNGAVPGTATDGGAAPALDSHITTPQNGSALNAGTGAIAVNQHSADPSLAQGVPTQAPAAAAVTPAPVAAEQAAPAPGLVQPQVTPVQPIHPSAGAYESEHVNAAAPVAAPGSTTGSTISSSAPAQQPQQLNSVAPAAAAAAATAPVVAHPAPTTVAAGAPKAALPPKEVKKMEKLMKTEAKNEQKSIKRAIKDAASSEKLFRKARDAEAQSIKRHQKATTNEHKTSKALSTAKAEHEKMAAALSKAVEDLDIKKRYTEATRDGYEKSKKKIDELRNQKTVNDQARSRQHAQLHGGAAV